jgi:hypothetical protein
MKSFKEIINEAKGPYEIYHSSYTSAIKEVEAFVKKKGFILDKEEMASEIGMGPAKPGAGKTNKFTLKLYKTEADVSDGKPVKKAVHFQIYGMGSTKSMSADKFELNVYIS